VLGYEAVEVRSFFPLRNRLPGHRPLEKPNTFSSG